MSETILQRSKFLCFFQIDKQHSSQKVEQIYKPSQLPLMLYHFHYSVLYFPILFNHFRVYFPQNIGPNHLRLKYQGKELPYDLPIGLFLPILAKVQVTWSEWPCPQGFKLMMISWKKGYTIVNRQGGCDHLYKKLNQSSQIQLFNKHVKGNSHELHKIPKYEGNAIAIRLLLGDRLIQRMCTDMTLTIGEYIQNQFTNITSRSNSIAIYTHNIKINLGLSLKELLEQWNYNDGFCYLKIQFS